MIENKFIKYYFEGDILVSEYKIPIDIDVQFSREVIKLRKEISANKSQYWCYDITNIKSMDVDSRNYADMYGQELLCACAVVVNSQITQFIFNVFLKLKSPKGPFRSFSKKDEAIVWLKRIKATNERKKY